MTRSETSSTRSTRNAQGDKQDEEGKGRAQHSSTFDRAWNPGYVEIKGWVKDWHDVKKREEQMMTTDEIDKLLEVTKAILGDKWSKIVEEDTYRSNKGRLLSSKVILRLKANI